MSLEFRSSRKFPCVILAGGLSRRMGTNKAMAIFGGRPMLHHIVERLSPQATDIALNADGDWAEAQGLPVIGDTIEGKQGPLAGVLAAMRDTKARFRDVTHVLTVPTDAPLLPDNLIEKLSEKVDTPDTIAVASSAGELHPVVALWPVGLADELERWTRSDEKRRVRHFMAQHRMIIVDFPLIETYHGTFDPFLNVNTPEELAAAEKWLEASRQ